MGPIQKLLDSQRPEIEDVVELFIDANAKPVQGVRHAARGGRVLTFQPQKVKDWKNMIKLLVQQQLPPGFKPFDSETGISAQALYVFKPVSTLKKADRDKIAAGGMVDKITKPDVNDNLNKGFFDALTGIVWEDDSRIVHSESSKKYGSKPGIYIVVGRVKQ